MRGPEWLTARPIAHRGLHDATRGIVENTPSSIAAAVSAGYALEVDVQITADGEAMVHHDDALGRLTEGSARLDTLTANALRGIAYKATADRMISLGELCDLVAGRATVLVEMKSHFDGDPRLPLRVAKVLEDYRGPIAPMSFDPLQIAVIRRAAPNLLRGLVAERHFRPGHQDRVSWRESMIYLGNVAAARPQFLAYSVRDLPSAPALAFRFATGRPLLTWTVRSEDDRNRAARWADQMIFEGFRP
ncbi:MAG TPA: glycerophosphodiester phosphodiesterase family protein [Xanthobacteraceae bacterium]|nr:glycerophosphodiester phosphodiesterase family protein [Xanthobacteraceae bacterium]